MDQLELVPAGRLRLDDVGRPDDAGLDHTGVDQLVLLSGEHVWPDIDVIPRRVDDIAHKAPAPLRRLRRAARRPGRPTGSSSSPAERLTPPAVAPVQVLRRSSTRGGPSSPS